MFIVGLLSWWYGDGWRQRFVVVKERIAAIVDFFSIDLLVKTIFSPYRQISAGRVNGSLDVIWRAFVDQLISRCIGAVLRIGVILAGVAVIVCAVCVYAVVLLFWALVPVLPIAGMVMMFTGWTLP